MTTLLFTPPEVCPASPASIPATASLDDLHRIKQSWLQAARDLGYPEIIWQVAYWLGTKVHTASLRECQVWQSSEVAIIANEFPLRFLPEQNLHLMQRSFSVWLSDGQRQNPRPNLVDDIVFNSHLVARWAWLVAGPQIDEIEKELLFIPGQWLHPILAELSHVHHLSEQHCQKNVEVERQTLLAQLLIGMEV